MAERSSSQVLKRKELVARLNPTCQRAFKAAADSAKLRGNPYVELTHFIEQLALTERGDVGLILAEAEVDTSRLAADMTGALDRLPYGATAIQDFSDHVFHAIQEGLSYGALRARDEMVRSGSILLAVLKVPVLEGLLGRISGEFTKIDADALGARFDAILEGSIEAAATARPAELPPRRGSESALSKYASDLTARARTGGIDPVVGRDPEIRQIIDVLMRRRQNNPILTGEAGVGKTAVVEGFALRVAAGDVPPALRSVSLRVLDIGLMQAGASVKGEFEKRLRAVIDEVQASETPIILFIDEAHTLIGAGGAAGTGDAANLLKPALARGELRTIAATTWAEYKQYIEPDPALTRRFQPVPVEEPDEATAVRMLRGVAGVLEAHHKVQVLDEAIEAAVALSHRYIPARQLPDKAVSLLDTACARVAVSQHATPAEVEDLHRRRAMLELERGIHEREAAIGLNVAARRGKLDAALAALTPEIAAAEARWEVERGLVTDILALRARLRGEGATLDQGEAPPTAPEPETGTEAPAPNRETDLAKLRALTTRLSEAQGEAPLILPSVDRNAVAAVARDWTGIPMGRMLASQTEKALNLTGILAERVVGQDHAMEMIAARVRTSRAGLGAPEKPVGVFLLCGPSGVGKTETALALADTLYGGEQNLITINMSEFQEAHTVSLLKGAPPGYVGYGKGGVLTEAVRRKPYSVVLLDEVEKAHPDVHEIFFQVFDKGVMDDSEGRRIDFKNCLILLTSNVGSEVIMRATEAGRKRGAVAELDRALRPPLLAVFPAAFLGRVITVPYYPLSDAMIDQIATARFARIGRQLSERYEAELVIGPGVLEMVRARCVELESGGRMIDAILTNTVLPDLSAGLLRRTLEGAALSRVTVGVGDDGFSYAFE